MKNKKYVYLSLISVLVCIVIVGLLLVVPKLVNNSVKEETLPEKVEIIWEKISPDKRYNAVMFSNPEDKTAIVRYQLSIIPNCDKITKEDTANVFSYDGIYDIEWENETTLLVKKYEEGEEYYKVEEYNGIKIKYLSPSETREHEKNKRE